MENLREITIEKKYSPLKGVYTIPNIDNKNYLSFSYAATDSNGDYLVSGIKTFDLRLIRNTYGDTAATSTIKIYENNYIIEVRINFLRKTIEFKGSDIVGAIYSHNS